jgi:precorrin-2 dehydrogenase/sirohydrochlorin ferrochelatase
MTLYPVNFNLNKRECLVLGGGEVAERKTNALLSAGGRVTVLSPRLTPKLRELSAKGRITHVNSSFHPGSIGSFFLVFCATDNAEVNRLAADEARNKGALVNVADAPELCDFTVPANVVRGDLVITVSTNGKSPALARRLREELEQRYGPEYGLYLELVARLRSELMMRPGTATQRQSFWRDLLDHEVLDLLRAGKINEAEEKIRNAASCAWTKS